MENEAAIVISKSTVKKVGAFLGIGGFIVIATMSLHLRAASGDVPPMRLVPVSVETVDRQESYQVSEFLCWPSGSQANCQLIVRATRQS